MEDLWVSAATIVLFVILLSIQQVLKNGIVTEMRALRASIDRLGAEMRADAERREG